MTEVGKALAGASGGYTSAHGEIVDMLRQRSRPYLFSNTFAPAIVGASLRVLDLVKQTKDLRPRLFSNTRFSCEKMTAIGFDIPPGEHPIVPVMLGDAVLVTKMAGRLSEKRVYVVGFSYPVVPKGKARIRVQFSTAHTPADLEFAIARFVAVRAELPVY